MGKKKQLLKMTEKQSTHINVNQLALSWIMEINTRFSQNSIDIELFPSPFLSLALLGC